MSSIRTILWVASSLFEAGTAHRIVKNPLTEFPNLQSAFSLSHRALQKMVYFGSPAGSLMRENQDRLEVTGRSASGVNVVIHV